MTAVRSLRIRMGTIDLGSLFALDDGRTYFRFDEACATMVPASRPILSVSYEGDTDEVTRRQLLDVTLEENRGDGRGGLPPFFENLLPEGRLRRHLIEEARIDPSDSLSLLAYCGSDLPGNVQAVAEKLSTRELARLITQGHDSYELSSDQLPTPEAQSISGVQPKVGLVRDPGGHYVMRSKTGSGHFIGKLPTGDYPQLPEVEHASLLLAQAAGVTTCSHELLPLHQINDKLPFEMRDDAQRFLLVHRFDRDANTPNGRLHAEDFAQITATVPMNKYRLGYAEVGKVILARSTQPKGDLLELVRRITVNELLGNPDAHLKNFGFLYPTPRTPVLSPAYDIVAYSVYNKAKGHGLALAPGYKERLLSPMVLRIWTNLWDIPTQTLSDTVTATVDSAMRKWPTLLPTLELSDEHRQRLWAYVESCDLAQKWIRRHAPPAMAQ